MKTDVFQSCGHCWVFQICWHIECSIFTASSFRIRNSSTGIPSHPLFLFVVMLPKAHLTSHSRMLALGEWSYHHDYPGREDLFLYRLSLYSCHLFLISSASVRSLLFLSFIVLILAFNIPLIPPVFLQRSLVFPILKFSSVLLHCSRKKAFLSLCYSLEQSFEFQLLLVDTFPGNTLGLEFYSSCPKIPWKLKFKFAHISKCPQDKSSLTVLYSHKFGMAFLTNTLMPS